MILKSERHKVNAKDHFKGGACKSRLALLLFSFFQSEFEDGIGMLEVVWGAFLMQLDLKLSEFI